MDVVFVGRVIKSEADLESSENKYIFDLFYKDLPYGRIQLKSTRVFNYGDKVPIRFYNTANGNELEFSVKTITSDYVDAISSFVENGKMGHRLVIETDHALSDSMAKIIGPIRNHFNIEFVE